MKTDNDKAALAKAKAAIRPFLEALTKAIEASGFDGVSVWQDTDQRHEVTLRRDGHEATVTICVESHGEGGVGYGVSRRTTGLLQACVYDVLPRRTFRPTIRYTLGVRRATPIKPEAVAKSIIKGFEQAVARDGEKQHRDALEAEYRKIVEQVNAEAHGAKVCLLNQWNPSEHWPHLTLRTDLTEDEMIDVVKVLRDNDILTALAVEDD